MPETQKARGGIKQIGRVLDQNARVQQFPAAMPRRYRMLSAVDLYQQFLRGTPDFKGMIANGYGASGLNVQLSAAMGSDSFKLPGLMNFSVKVTADTGIARSAIISLHRSMPRCLTTSVPPSVAPGVPGNVVQPLCVLWESQTPVCLMGLYGTSVSAGAGVSAVLGLAQELPPLPSDTAQLVLSQGLTYSEIPLALGVEIGAEAGSQYDLLYARDPGPRWYPHAADQRLVDDFNHIFYVGRHSLKRDILAWIERFERKIYPLDDKTLNMLEHHRAELYLMIFNRQLNYLQPSRKADKGIWSSISSRLKSIRPDLSSSSFPKLHFAYSTFSQFFSYIHSNNYRTDELRVFISNLKLLIPPDSFIDMCVVDSSVPQETITSIKLAFNGFRRQLDLFEQQIRAFQANAEIPSDLPVVAAKLSDQFNCFLKIASHTATGNAGVQARAIAAYTGAGITGSYKKTTYRYQTFTPSQDPRQHTLIYTQDTSITYREASVRSEAGIGPVGREWSKGVSLRAMSYRSACVYWLYPDNGTANAYVVSATKGSGYSYGVSVKTQELFACIENVQTRRSPDRYTRMSRLLARYLRLDEATFFDYLRTLDVTFLQNHISTPAVLLEANYAFPLGISLVAELKVKSNQRQSVNVHRLRSLWDPQYDEVRRSAIRSGRQAIRIRARMADFQDSSISFKLGIPVSLAEAGITLSRIETAGQEGVLDIHQTYWTHESYDDCVPPVALFYQ